MVRCWGGLRSSARTRDNNSNDSGKVLYQAHLLFHHIATIWMQCKCGWSSGVTWSGEEWGDSEHENEIEKKKAGTIVGMKSRHSNLYCRLLLWNIENVAHHNQFYCWTSKKCFLLKIWLIKSDGVDALRWSSTTSRHIALYTFQFNRMNEIEEKNEQSQTENEDNRSNNNNTVSFFHFFSTSPRVRILPSNTYNLSFNDLLEVLSFCLLANIYRHIFIEKLVISNASVCVNLCDSLFLYLTCSPKLNL